MHGTSGPGVTSRRWMRNSPIGVPSSDGYVSWLHDHVGHATAVAAPARRRPTRGAVAARRAGRGRATATVGAPNESTTANASPVSRSAVSPVTATTSPRPSTSPSGRRRRVVAPHGVDGSTASPRRAARRPRTARPPSTASPSARASPTPAACGAASGARTTRPRERPERRDADERGAVGGERERRRGLLAGDGGRPRPGGRSQQVDVDPRPADHDVHEQPRAVRRHRDGRPRLRVGGASAHTTGSSSHASPSTWWCTVRWYWSPAG